jgi:transposase InsO family protein
MSIMESMGKKKPRPRRSFTPEFKAEIVELCRRGDRSAGQIARTAFYARRSGKPGPRAVQDAELTQQITAVHERSRGTYGAPRVHAVLKQEGAGCGRRRVARLMRAAGLEGRHRRRRHLTTIPDPRAALRPDLVVRNFAPDAAGLDTRWCGDIT